MVAARLEHDFVDDRRVINVGQPPSFHLLNPINTKHQETLQKSQNNYKNIKMPSASSRKNQTNSNNRQKQRHTTAPSASKKPNKHDYTEWNEDKKIFPKSKNQTARTESRIAGNFANSHEKCKLTTSEISGQPPAVLKATIHCRRRNQARRWGNWGPNQAKSAERSFQKSGIWRGKSR